MDRTITREENYLLPSGGLLASFISEWQISSLISLSAGKSEITHVSSELSRASRQIGHVLCFTFLKEKEGDEFD